MPARLSASLVLLSARYDLQQCLGKGGYGTVYQAWDRERGCTVALKILDVTQGEPLRRFKAEFRALADLSHPNLVALYDLIGEDDHWCFSMELLDDAVPFIQWVRPGPLDADRARDALRQLAAGLQVLHRAGYLHRDVKPANVLVTRAGRVVLLDFGLVTDLDPHGHARSESVVGTPAYMPPEMAAGQTATPASDWYSVGVMLYECLTGRSPFEGELYEVLTQKLRPLPPERLAALRGTPPDLATLCMGLLDVDPGARPDGAHILARLGAPVIGDAEPHLPLVGRDAELATLREAWRDSVDHPVAVCVQGPSGMGKTALVTSFLHECQAVVLSGRCYEQEAVPYKALDALVDSLGRWLLDGDPQQVEALLPADVMALTRIFPALLEVPAIAHGRHAVVQGPDLRRRATAALRELLARIAREHRLVLFIDDLQWTDHDSTVLLEALLTAPDAPHCLLVVAWRTDEASVEARLGPDVRPLPLTGLAPEAARALVRHLVAADVEPLVADAAGHPYLLTELARAWQGGSSEAAACTLDEALARRIERLPDPARRLLEVLSVSGRPLPEDLALQAAQADLGVLGSLRAQHLIRGTGGQIAPYHDRIRETRLSHLDAAARRAWHATLAQRLEGRPDTDPETILTHALAAEDLERARRYAPLAAAAAESAMAFDRAVRLYTLALQLAPSAALRVKRADALLAAGRGAEAAAAYLEAAGQSQATEALDLTRRAAHEYLCSGHIDEGLETLDRVLRRQGLHLARTPRAALPGLVWRRALLTLRGAGFVERPASPATLARIDTCWSAVVGLSMVDTVRAAEMQTRHAWLALQAGEPTRVARALAWEVAFCSGFKGSEALVRRLDTACRTLLARLGDAELDGRAAHTLGLGLFVAGEFPAALSQFDTAVEKLRPYPRTAWAVNNAHLFRFISAFYTGRLPLIRDGYADRLAIAREHGDRYAEANFRARLAWMTACMDDDPDGAAQAAAHALDGWHNRGYHLMHWYRWLGQVEVQLYRGDVAAAWAEVERQWSDYRQSALSWLQICHVVSLDLRARAALGMARRGPRERWLPVAARDIERLSREARPYACVMATLLRAGLSALRNDDAAPLAAQAEALARDCGMALHAAAAAALQGRAAEIAGVVSPARWVSMLAPWTEG